MNVSKEKLTVWMAKKQILSCELSQKTGISRTTIHKILSGKIKPRPKTIGKIADALGIKVEDLLDESND